MSAEEQFHHDPLEGGRPEEILATVSSFQQAFNKSVGSSTSGMRSRSRTPIPLVRNASSGGIEGLSQLSALPNARTPNPPRLSAGDEICGVFKQSMQICHHLFCTSRNLMPEVHRRGYLVIVRSYFLLPTLIQYFCTNHLNQLDVGGMPLMTAFFLSAAQFYTLFRHYLSRLHHCGDMPLMSNFLCVYCELCRALLPDPSHLDRHCRRMS